MCVLRGTRRVAPKLKATRVPRRFERDADRLASATTCGNLRLGAVAVTAPGASGQAPRPGVTFVSGAANLVGLCGPHAAHNTRTRRSVRRRGADLQFVTRGWPRDPPWI